MDAKHGGMMKTSVDSHGRAVLPQRLKTNTRCAAMKVLATRRVTKTKANSQVKRPVTATIFQRLKAKSRRLQAKGIHRGIVSLYPKG